MKTSYPSYPKYSNQYSIKYLERVTYAVFSLTLSYPILPFFIFNLGKMGKNGIALLPCLTRWFSGSG